MHAEACWCLSRHGVLPGPCASLLSLTAVSAGLAAGGWTVGDKTGTGDTQINDAAIAEPPDRAPQIAATHPERG